MEVDASTVNPGNLCSKPLSSPIDRRWVYDTRITS